MHMKFHLHLMQIDFLTLSWKQIHENSVVISLFYTYNKNEFFFFFHSKKAHVFLVIWFSKETESIISGC